MGVMLRVAGGPTRAPWGPWAPGERTSTSRGGPGGHPRRSTASSRCFHRRTVALEERGDSGSWYRGFPLYQGSPTPASPRSLSCGSAQNGAGKLPCPSPSHAREAFPCRPQTPTWWCRSRDPPSPCGPGHPASAQEGRTHTLPSGRPSLVQFS